MIENLIILLFDIGLIAAYLTIGAIVAILIQLISYRIFNFNLYKFIRYYVIDKQLIK